MGTSFATAMRRFASTIFVLLALVVASSGAAAAPCMAGASLLPGQASNHAGAGTGAAAMAHAVLHTTQQAAPVDDLAGLDANDPVPSLEDNTGGLDDTFDVPPAHLVSIPRVIPGRPGGVVPMPHAHHASLELRPPIG